MFLWDLAGQPGYRLIHQLHLNEVAIALVVFDACSETDPFKGVYYWDHALRQVQHLHGSRASAMKKLLVAARIDRGGIRASRARIELLVRELGFAGYFETSAKEGWGIVELTKAIKETADWVILPKVTSTDLFLHIKNFLTTEKHTGRLLTTVEDLYHAFLRIEQALTESDELQVQFDTCLGRLESQDLIRRLSFGNLVLLQPELLDAYASALVNTVKDEPDGMGYIAEERVRRGEFAIPGDERIADRNHESLLLIAMVEDLLHHEIALREYADDGPYLIFPAQSVRERPDLPDPEGKAVIFDFEGPVLNIYATLAVRLSHSGVFRRKEIWKDAMTYTTWMGGIYGMFLRNIDEGRGELVLFFDKEASEETRFHFEKYIQVHLERWALPESIKRQRILSFICSTCGEAFTESQVEHRRGLGFKWMRCSVCDSQVSLPTEDQRVSLVPKMDHAADVQRAREVTTSILQGRREIGDFDVFLCYNSQDRLKVKEIAEQLKAHGILPWLDEWELRPGLPWQRPLEQQIAKIKSAAVFVGRTGVGGKNVVGPWQQQELEAFLREFVKRGCPVIPVLLTNARRKPSLPIFLQGMTWVDFQQPDPDPMEQLLWGITGKNYDELLL